MPSDFIRARVDCVWVAEIAYRESNWITLWTTCRPTRAECRSALNRFVSARNADVAIKRVVKFTREFSHAK